MFFLYLALWIIFNGRVTLEIIIIGSIIGAALTAFMCKFGDYSLQKEKAIVKKIGYFIKYVLVLIREIVKANIEVIKLIVSGTDEPEPAVVEFETDLKRNATKAMLANAITLTPGTITVLLEENKCTVHCLDDTFADGINKSEFVEILSEIDK